MTKRAFVVGANCNKLNYARSDAEKIAKAFTALDYQVADLPTQEENSELLKRFKIFAQQSKANDTLIFYFAGHGKFVKPSLFLALDSSDFLGLNISDITNVFEVCDASNKLIILDCCEAAIKNLDMDNSENYQVLRATRTVLDKAIEVPELESGLFSHCLYQVLINPNPRKLNFKRQLTTNALADALREQIDAYKAEHPEQKVPDFVISGQQTNHFIIGEFPPRYPGLLAVTPEFIAQEGDKHLSDSDLYSCEQFYGANPQAQWWGVVQGLVAKRQIYTCIKDHIYTTLQRITRRPIITLILGSGGMGKSTLLQQLAVDLAEDYPVFWLENWESFAEQDTGELLVSEDATVLICLDNWHRFDDDEKKAMKRWWHQQTKFHSKVKWLISDRNQARNELGMFIYGDGQFDLDALGQEEKQQDNLQLLAKVAERREQWQTTIASLSNQNIALSKPFHILFVLFRWAGKARQLDFQDFEGIFCQLIREDIDSLRENEEFKGFADALIDFAVLFIRFKVRLTQATFLRLADFYNREKYLFSCYQATPLEDETWGLLRYYLSVFGTTHKLSGSEIILEFVKEDLAEAIVDIFESKFKLRKKLICHFIVEDASHFSASRMLYAAAHKEVFDAATTLIFIKKLLNKNNNDFFYPHLLFGSRVVVSREECESLLEQYIAINQHYAVVCRYLGLLDKTKAQQKATELLAQPNQHAKVIIKCLNILDEEQAKENAMRLLAQPNQHAKVISKCLNILDEEQAKENAMRLLAQPNQHAEVICKCLNILDEEQAKENAMWLLAQPDQNVIVISKCFRVLNKDEVVKNFFNIVVELLNKPSQNAEIITICLGILDKEQAQEKAMELLAKPNQNPSIICKCLHILDKNLAQKKAIELLVPPYRNGMVINICLNILDKEQAQEKAMELLAKPNQNPSVIGKCFHILDKKLAQEKAMELLALPYGDSKFVNTCLNILDEEQAQEKAIELLAQPNQSPVVIKKCLKILEKKSSNILDKGQEKKITEIQQTPIELLAQDNQRKEVVRKFFAALGKDEQAKKHARQFLQHSDDEVILARCVNILEEEAKPFALKQLKNWRALNPKHHLLQNCLYVCRNEEKIVKIVKTIIKEKNSNRDRYFSVLRLPLTHLPIWQQETTNILTNWRTCNRAYVNASLRGNRADLAIVKKTCQEILHHWEREICYQQKKGYMVYYFHILKALSYPSAEDPSYRGLVKMTAKIMLNKEKLEPGFLGDVLYKAAYNIVHHQQYPLWIPEEET